MKDVPDDWTDEQKDLYAKVYQFALSNQMNIAHPDARRMPDEQWDTLCHNFAFFAALKLDPESGDLILCNDDNEELARESRVLH